MWIRRVEVDPGTGPGGCRRDVLLLVTFTGNSVAKGLGGLHSCPSTGGTFVGSVGYRPDQSVTGTGVVSGLTVIVVT